MGPYDWGGTATAGVAGGGAGGAAGMALQLGQMIYQDQQNTRAYGRQKELMDIQNRNALRMWKATGPTGQMEQLKKAGLNPGLVYGMGGAGGATAQSAGASQPAGNYTQNMGMNFAEMALLDAQRRNIEADTKNKEATATKTSGVDTDKTKTEIEMNKLSQVIADYTGREAKDIYERIMSPNRGVQAKMHQEEMEARQAVAGTVYEMWMEGKLKDKANAEVQEILLKNAKTEEETKNIKKTFEILEENLKGEKFDNVIREIEAKVNSTTGLSRENIMRVIMLLLTKGIKQR